MTESHIPVLLEEVIKMTAPQVGETVVDCTFGGGGHARALCERIGSRGTLIGLDADTDALKAGRKDFADHDGCRCNWQLRQENFRELDRVLVAEGIGGVDIFLFDLGLRSGQLESSGRGFTFQKDEPLYMTYRDPDETTESDITAYEIVNEWSREHLVDILESYGNEPDAEAIAGAIVELRQAEAIETTGQLVAVIEGAAGKKHPRERSTKLHPATRTFQALRIAVNDEIRALQDGLEKAVEFLSPAGRLAVISFHSLEDRTVKRTFDEAVYAGMGEVLEATPITPTPGEVATNPRSRSAKLRVFKSS